MASCCNSKDSKFQELTRAIGAETGEKGSKINLDTLRKFLEGYKSRSGDWKVYAKADKTVAYSRNLVVKYPNAIILILVWNEGKESPIHDHSGSSCFVKVLQGSLTETRYHWPECSTSCTEMTEMSDNTYKENQVTYIDDSLGLHRMTNASHSDECITMHVYTPVMEHCQVFDDNTGKAETKTMTYRTPTCKQ